MGGPFHKFMIKFSISYVIIYYNTMQQVITAIYISTWTIKYIRNFLNSGEIGTKTFRNDLVHTFGFYFNLKKFVSNKIKSQTMFSNTYEILIF